jgi:hypothetical protein
MMIRPQLILESWAWSLKMTSYDVQTTGNLAVGSIRPFDLERMRFGSSFFWRICSRSAGVPWYITTGIEGVQRWNSSSQFESVLNGATMRCGPKWSTSSRSLAMREIVWMVLPMTGQQSYSSLLTG